MDIMSIVFFLTPITMREVWAEVRLNGGVFAFPGVRVVHAQEENLRQRLE
jgi:hypothetical protein